MLTVCCLTIDATGRKTGRRLDILLIRVFFAGFPAGNSLVPNAPVTRGVFKIALLSMPQRLGWLYLISPNRLCNHYLLSDQQT